MKMVARKMTRTLCFLKWIRDHSGFWYLICTPDEEHMNLDMAKRLLIDVNFSNFPTKGQ